MKKHYILDTRFLGLLKKQGKSFHLKKLPHLNMNKKFVEKYFTLKT